jgi:hypothetical protein
MKVGGGLGQVGTHPGLSLAVPRNGEQFCGWGGGGGCGSSMRSSSSGRSGGGGGSGSGSAGGTSRSASGLRGERSSFLLLCSKGGPLWLCLWLCLIVLVFLRFYLHYLGLCTHICCFVYIFADASSVFRLFAFVYPTRRDYGCGEHSPKNRARTTYSQMKL